MPFTTLSSREFNQDFDSATKATADGPVFITDDGEPAHVLLSIEEYRRITDGHGSLIDALAMPGLSDIDLDYSLPDDRRRSIDFP